MDEQKISGKENFQASSEGDMNAAVGDEAIAAGRDVVINKKEEHHHHYYPSPSTTFPQNDEKTPDDIQDSTKAADKPATEKAPTINSSETPKTLLIL